MSHEADEDAVLFSFSDRAAQKALGLWREEVQRGDSGERRDLACLLGPYRIGQIVPSSNTTMETEIPAMLRAREAVEPERFTFHSSRMRMKKVTKEELAAMDADSDRCAAELSDARVDVLGYACLVAIMSMGEGYHRAVASSGCSDVTERERRRHPRS